MAEAGVLASVGWLVSPLMNKLFNKAYDLLGTGIDERRKILAATVLPRLSLAIEKAEKSPKKEKLVDWLNRLKGAYYEAEDAIDLFEYELLEQKVKDDRKTLEQKEKSKRGIRIVPQKLKDSFSVFSQKKIKLKDCIDKLIEIAKEANEFRDLLEDQENGSGSDADRETISENPHTVFGRDVDKENIVCLLMEKPFNSGPAIPIVIKNMIEIIVCLLMKKPLNSERRPRSRPVIPVVIKNIIEIIVGVLMKKPSNSEPRPSTKPAIPIISITGRSGVGKTALAQYVYNHMDEQNHFDILVWVHTPRKFKATDVIKNMIEILKTKECASNDYPTTSLEALLTKIRSMLRSKKLLLVLDDFWSDTEDFVAQWENFISCLSSCSPGSSILLTTQSKNVSKKANLPGVTEVKTYYLQAIEQDQFFELFMHYAWRSNSHLQKEEFGKIGRKIAIKLKGDPGAAKLVGQQLSGKNLRYWEEVAEKDWLGDNMKARMWSYQQLPLDLQRCFAIWGLFSKGDRFSRKLLIPLWMAEGFIRPIDKQERLEDIGENYLDELVSRFFIEEVEAEGEKQYQLHDLLHDLAERVQGDDFIRIDSTNSREVSSHISNMLSRSENIRHIHMPSSMINELKEKLCLMNNIRTFWVESDGHIVPKNVLREILKHMEKLRVLHLSECFDDFPDSIGNLKHLRCLIVIGYEPLKKFPGSICKLYHLQILVLSICESLPKDFCELISLRWFYTSREIRSRISHVGRLTSLQELNDFVVRKECGYELHQLKNLNQLRGKMRIAGLENVASTEDAIKANMPNKTHLATLEFEWNSDGRDTNNATCLSTPHVELLDALQPHPRISVLTLKGFGGDRIPNWLQSKNSLKHLTLLTLMDCDKVKEISSINESLPNCKVLVLQRLENLKELPSLPPNLTYLVIDHLPKLSYFSEDDLLKKEERNQSKHEVVKLIAEYLKPEDVRLPRNFESTVMHFFLFVKHRLDAAFYDFPDLVSAELAVRLAFHNYSRELFLDAWVMLMHCHMETMFYKNEESKLVLPSSLTYLEISSCSITDDALSTCIQCLVSLSKLKLSDIQTITSLPPKEVLCSLKNLLSLTIKGCYLLSSLGGIGALTSLIKLKLENCPNLNTSNEPFPSSLERLIFNYCSNADVIHARNVSDVSRVLDVGNLSLLKELFLMGWYGHLEGLHSLTSLRTLHVGHCPAINLSSPMDKCALKNVLVDDLKLLKLILSNETISSIEFLTISGFQGDSSDDEVFQSLTSLNSLGFHGCKTTHLPKNLKNLASVEFVILGDCPNLCKLEELPSNLCRLIIENCPNLICELEQLPKNLRKMKIKDCSTLTEKFKQGGPNFQVGFDEGYTIVTFPTEEGRYLFS